MATQKWGTAGSLTTVSMASGWSSLANGSRIASSAAIDNDADLYTMMAIEATFSHASAIWGSAPVAGAHLAVYAVPLIDPSNALDGVSVAPGGNLQIGSIPIRAAASQTASRTGDPDMEIPAFDFYLVIQNNTGQAFNSSVTGTIKIRRYNITVA